MSSPSAAAPSGFLVRDSQELQAGSLSVGDGNVGAHGGDPLRLAKTGQADQVRSRVRIDDFNRVVTERRDKKFAGYAVEGEMIDSPFDSRKRDRKRERDEALPPYFPSSSSAALKPVASFSAGPVPQ